LGQCCMEENFYSKKTLANLATVGQSLSIYCALFYYLMICHIIEVKGSVCGMSILKYFKHVHSESRSSSLMQRILADSERLLRTPVLTARCNCLC